METYVRKAEDLDAVNANFMPPLLDAILGDYNCNVATARDAEVLNVMASIISRLGVRIESLLHISQLTRPTFLASSDASNTCHFGCSLRADVEYDQSRLC